MLPVRKHGRILDRPRIAAMLRAMAAFRLTSLLLVAAAFAACNEPAPAGGEAAQDADAWLARELGWVEGADATSRAAQDHARNEHRFLSVCGVGCSVVGVSDITVRMCFPQVAVVIVDKTTEAVQSERHAEMKKQARAFAEAYNRLTEANLRSLEKGSCPPAVDWDRASTEIAAVLDRIYTSGFRGDVYVSDQRRAFQVRLPRGASREDVRTPMCDILKRNGLVDRATLEVKGVDVQEDYAPLAC